MPLPTHSSFLFTSNSSSGLFQGWVCLEHRISEFASPLFWPRGCSCLLTTFSRTFCWDVQMLVLCLSKFLGVLSCDFFLMIVAACSAMCSGAWTPFFSAFGGMCGDGNWAPSAVWGSGVRKEPWFWKALVSLDRPGGLDTAATSTCKDFSWFTTLKLKTTWL